MAELHFLTVINEPSNISLYYGVLYNLNSQLNVYLHNEAPPFSKCGMLIVNNGNLLYGIRNWRTMVVWWRLLLAILAATKHTSCLTTESEYMAMEYFKNSHKLLDTVLNYDYQDTVQELIRAHRADRDLGLGLNRKISKVLDDEMGQDYQQSIESLSPMIGKRHMRSQRLRRDKLNLQGVRSHRAHSLESGRRQRIQPDSQQEY